MGSGGPIQTDMVSPAEEVETQLYRAFDSNGVLLYVGISTNCLNRILQHKRTRIWFQRLANLTVEHYPTRELALDAECLAIRIEKPLYNRVTYDGVVRLSNGDTRQGKTCPSGCDCNRHYPVPYTGNPDWEKDCYNRGEARANGTLSEWYEIRRQKEGKL